MSNRPPEELKETANQLARLLFEFNEKNENIIRSLQGQFPPHAPKSEREPGSETADGTKKMGIWTPKVEAGVTTYIRDQRDVNSFPLWSGLTQIPPKSARKRIVFLGESVGRGFFFDPFYTPAGVLSSILNQEPSPLDVEVLDLAKIDLSLDELTELTSSVMALSPDALVIFAGNNWLNPERFSKEILQKIIGVMEKGGHLDEIRNIFEKNYQQLVRSFMKHLGKISVTKQVPVIFLIPEFNLVDYRITPEHRLIIWRKNTEKWLDLKKRGEAALKMKDFGEAEFIFQEMIDENEADPLGHELLGKCRIGQNRFAQAAVNLRDALTRSIVAGQSVPCCTQMVRRVILEEARESGIFVVDLPDVFAQHQGGRPAGKELFLDYCHLSAEGIQLAMSHAARCLYFILGNGDLVPQTDELRKTAPVPQAGVLARAHFFAAIHNAHRGDQPFNILKYHCLQALKVSSDTRDLMENFIEMICSHTPWSLSRGCEKLYGKQEQKQFLFLRQPRNLYTMDVKLADAMAEALKMQGTDIGERILNLRKKEHGFMGGKIDLLESYYHITSYDLPFMQFDHGYYRAYGSKSCFLLIMENQIDVCVQFVCRVRGMNGETGKIFFQVNGAVIEELPVRQVWNEFYIQIQADLLQEGINEVIIHWPVTVQPEPGKRASGLGTARANLFTYMCELMYTVYGEIHTLTARPFNLI